MKTKDILKYLSLVIAFAAFTGMHTYAQVTETVCWKFGSSPIIVNSYDKAWSESDFSDQNYNQTKDGLTISRYQYRNSTVNIHDDYIFDKKTLKFSFSINGPGTLYVAGYQRNDNDEAGGKARTVTAHIGGTEYQVGGSGYFNDIYYAKEGSLTIENITSTTTVELDGTSAAFGWSYIMWVPANKKNMTVSLSTSSTTFQQGTNDVAINASVIDQSNSSDITSKVIGDMTWTSSNTNVVTLANSKTTGASNTFNCVGPGTATLTLRYPSSDRAPYNAAFATIDIRVTETLPAANWPVGATQIKRTGNRDLSSLAPNTMKLYTGVNVNAADYITVYSGNNVVRPSGNMTVASLDETYITTSEQSTSNWNLTGVTTTADQGKIAITWKPWDNYAGTNMVSVDNLTGNGSRNDRVVTLTNSNRMGWDYSGSPKNLYFTDEGNTKYLKYFCIELNEPTPAEGDGAQVMIAAEYSGKTFNPDNDVVFVPRGSRFITIPLNPNYRLTKINLGVVNDSGTASINIKSAGFSTADYFPTYAELEGLSVAIGLRQTNTIVNQSDRSLVDTYTTSEDGYIQIPYDASWAVWPQFIRASDGVNLTKNGIDEWNISVDFEKDSNDDPITVFTYGTHTPDYGYITPTALGRAIVTIGMKSKYTEYQQTSQKTKVEIVKATPRIANPTGGLLSEAYNGTKLGLNTLNTINLDGKFYVFNAKGEDITEHGAFTYEDASDTNRFSINGSNISANSAGLGNIKITWVPDSEYAQFYNSKEGVLYGVVVTEADASVTATPNPFTVTEGGEYPISGAGSHIAVTVNKTDGGNTTTVDNPTLTYSIVGSTDYIELALRDGITYLKAKQYTTTPQTLRISWTDTENNSTVFSTDVAVNVKMRIGLSVSDLTVKQGEIEQLSYTVYRDLDNNGSYNDGDIIVPDIVPKATWSNFHDSGNTDAYISVSDNLEVTGLVPGHGPGIASGTVALTLTITDDGTRKGTTQTCTVTVTDNHLFDYMGWDLQPGHEGILSDPTNSDKHYIHWRFGQDFEEEGSWRTYVYEYIKPSGENNFYGFTHENLKLKDAIHKSEKSFDVFYETHLTDTQRETINGVQSTKGDAFLEYNGMVAGYGTELGGRYMTPISGTFVRIEAEHDGIVTVRVRHNGSLDSSNYSTDTHTEKKDGKDVTITDGYRGIIQGRRAIFVVDENGVVMPRTTVNLSELDAIELNLENLNSSTYRGLLSGINGTYCRIGAQSAVNDRFDVVNDAYTAYFGNQSSWTGINDDVMNENGKPYYRICKEENQDFSKNAFLFCKNVIYGDVPAAEFNETVRNGYIQRLFYSETDDHVKYKGDGVNTTTYYFSKYGYEVLGATHLIMSFPVKAGKTYFVAANKSKVGLCTVEFLPSESYSATNVTLDENAKASDASIQWLKNTDDGAHLNVTLNRTFTAYRWTPLVLPFSVSESQLRSIFGDNVAVIALDGKLSMLSSMNNYATRDYSTTTDVETFAGLSDAHALQGTAADTRAFNGSQIKNEAIRNNSVTFTRHYYQMIYANCPVFIWTDRNVVNPTFNNVTFQKYRLDKTESSRTNPAINDDFSITFPYKVDRQIGTEGNEYDYVMKASYVPMEANTSTKDIYYINNVGTGISTKTYLYHAKAGENPKIKGMRVWIQAGENNRNPAPLRHIAMEEFWGEELDGFGSEATGICDIVAEQPNEIQYLDENVYDIMGRTVGHGTLEGLTPGLYIYKGQKIYIK